MNDNTSTKLNYPFRHFQLLGIIFGGIAPIFVFFLIAFVFGLSNFYIGKLGFIIIVLLWSLVLGITLALYVHEPEHGEKKWFNGLHLTQAILCFLLTLSIVYCTGGAINSVFAFTCLYIPSVVGYVYGKDDWSLKGASIAMAVSYIFNLISYSNYGKLPSEKLTTLVENGSVVALNKCNINGGEAWFSLEFMYGAFFILQISILYKIASQKEDLKKKEIIT